MGTIAARFRGQLGRFSLDVDFAVPASGVTGLFGPSGSGKTTILRALAGLVRFPDGRLTVDGAVWQDETAFLPTHCRPIGYVFQEPRLFSHLSVRGNLEYGRRRAGAETDPHRVAALMGIEKLLDRSVHGLSGGEQQRIAIARALLTAPRLLLMDEPLSALDKPSRNDILPYLETLHETLGLPIVYVTHDFAELERLADHLVLLRAGRVEAAGALGDLVTDVSLPITREKDAAAVLDVVVDTYDDAFDITACRIGAAVIQVPGHLGATGAKRRLLIRADDVSLVIGALPAASSLLNNLPARIVEASAVGRNQILVVLAPEGAPAAARLLSSITRKSWQTLKIRPGDMVFAQVKGMALADRR